MMPLQCATCAHYRGDNRCLAFPAGIPSEILTSEVDHDHVVEGQVGDYVWTEKKPRAARRHRTWFVVKCNACGETFFFSRPRRSWTRFTMPGHGPGLPCDNGHLRILHYAERLRELKKAGKI